jgi:3-carboxy-cis,cis-muconate cycloisomerase
MSLLSPLFGALDVQSHLSDTSRIQAMLDVEVALVEAQAALGLVPARSAAAISAAARADRYDLDLLAREAAREGNLAIPLVRLLTAQVAAGDADAARDVHLGATSQDIIDTGLILQLRAATPGLRAWLRRAMAACASHARAHRGTPMAGRTWLQQATPITFGLKAAGWLDALMRGDDRVARAGTEAFVLQFGGASGTLAALGRAAPGVARALGERLGLPLPLVPWHAHRDRLAGFGCALAVVTGTLGKIAKDLALLSQTEVAEVTPGAQAGGSTTMPHKRNPVASAVALAASIRSPGLAASLLAGMPQEHERGLGGWQAEWEVVPQLMLTTAGAARVVAEALEGLVVDGQKMAADLEMTRGLALSEAVVVELARHLGRPAARAIVEAACRQVGTTGPTLAEALSADPRVTAVLNRDAIDRCLSPAHYLGEASAFVEQVLGAWQRLEQPHG